MYLLPDSLPDMQSRTLLLNFGLQDGTPILLVPASKGFGKVCELLLEEGADPLTETKSGVSPLYAASKNGHKDVVKVLLKFKADFTKLCREVYIHVIKQSMPIH